LPWKNHKKRRLSKRNQIIRGNSPKIYFDACALESRILYNDFYTNNKYNNSFFVSHLSVGEAFCNCKDSEQRNAFISLFNNLEKDYKLQTIENDNCDKIFYNIKNYFDRFSLTDSLHLATAIHYKYDVFYTTDRDYDINTSKLNRFIKSNNYHQIKINKMKK